jgi:DNA-binding LytR/AlgR family response regulator
MTSKDRLIVVQQNFIHFVEKRQIIYCQSDNCYTSIYLTDGKILLLVKSLAKVMREDLNSVDFIRISQSYLINKNYIKIINKKKKLIELLNEHSVPFTVTLKELMELLSHPVTI